MADPLSLHAIAVMNDIHISVLFADSVWCTRMDGDVDKCDLILVCMDDGAQRRFMSVTCIDGQLTARKKKEVHKFCEDLLQKYKFASCSDHQPEVPPLAHEPKLQRPRELHHLMSGLALLRQMCPPHNDHAVCQLLH